MSLIGLLFGLLILCLVLWAVYAVITYLKVPDPVRIIIYVIVAIIALVFIANAAGISLPAGLT